MTQIQFKKPPQKIMIAGAVGILIVFFAFQYWKSHQFELPKGIASGNGRIEAKLVDISSKEALRVKGIFAKEGDLVQPGQILVQMDTVTLQSQLAEAKANVAASQERLAVARATIVKQKSQIELAKIEAERFRKLLAENAVPQREYDVRKTAVETNMAELAQAEAELQTAKQQVEAAQANVTTIQTRIDDATLRSPVKGRVLYRLSEPGETLAAGGKALTVVNLEDVYMEIFLPSTQAAGLKIGTEARLTVDYAPGRAAAAYVSFVSPEAQFTPKQVETRSERDKLMFRVKIQVPPELVSAYIERIKTGVRGVGYVKISESAKWPSWLQNLVLPANKPETKLV